MTGRHLRAARVPGCAMPCLRLETRTGPRFVWRAWQSGPPCCHLPQCTTRQVANPLRPPTRWTAVTVVWKKPRGSLWVLCKCGGCASGNVEQPKFVNNVTSYASGGSGLTTAAIHTARSADHRQSVQRSDPAHCAHWPQPSQRSDPAHCAHRLQPSQRDPVHSRHVLQPSQRDPVHSQHMLQPSQRDPLHHIFRHGWTQPRQLDSRHSWHRLQPSQREPLHFSHASQSSQRDPVHSRHMPQPSQRNDPMHSRHMLQPSQRDPVHSQRRNSLHNPQASQRDPMQPSSDIHATGEMWRNQCIQQNVFPRAIQNAFALTQPHTRRTTRRAALSTGPAPQSPLQACP